MLRAWARRAGGAFCGRSRRCLCPWGPYFERVVRVSDSNSEFTLVNFSPAAGCVYGCGCVIEALISTVEVKLEFREIKIKMVCD